MTFETNKQSSKPTREYRIEVDNDPSELAKKVTKLLNQGWNLDGSLQVVCPVVDGIRAPAFYQAMVR